MTHVFPWQQDILQGLLKRWQAGQLPHALLFSGIGGIGKEHFAARFAELLFCEKCQPQALTQGSLENLAPCGQCQGCKLIQAGSHPDFRFVRSEEGKAIPIDTIRGVGEFLSLKSQLAPMQVVIISPADKMNRFSANSLLKTLEEPTPNTLLILVTNRPSSLLPTIRSRCQSVAFHRPNLGQASEWLKAQCDDRGLALTETQLHSLLQLADRAPLTALAYAEADALNLREKLLTSLGKLASQQADPVIEAGNWRDSGVTQCVKWLTLWTMDMIRLKSGAQTDDNSTDGQWPALQKLSENSDLQRLFAYLDKLTESTRLLDTQVNQELMMEDLLISWSRLGTVR
jgi:DNA polymerase-3 subunit delta'